jgi:proteasome activator subunit 4
VRAHPFDVPPFLPGVLSALARNVGDPVPVAAAVKRVFNEFKRTHSDNWATHKAAFTDDQLSDLSGLLVSAHYYA